MKKMIFVSVLAVISLGLVGCGADNAAPVNTNENVSVTTTAAAAEEKADTTTQPVTVAEVEEATAAVTEKPTEENVVNEAAPAVTAEAPAVQAEPATAAETADENDFIKPFVGKWTYRDSETNNVSADGKDNGTVEIFADATYKYTDLNGNEKTGSITKFIEEIGGTEILRLDFTGDAFPINGAYYTESRPDELHFGNGDAARLVR